jgi:hypothetical protein
MANLYEILANAQGGQAMALLGREFDLSPKETEAAVTALLPAISAGLKRSTATPEGLGHLFGVMGQQPYLQAMYDDPATAFSREGIAAGNDALAVMFGSPDVSRAISAQAQQFSGIGSTLLKQILPVIAGILISGLMRGGSGQAAPSAPSNMPTQGGDWVTSWVRFSDARRLQGVGSRLPCPPASQSPLRPTRVASPCPAVIYWVISCANSKKESGRGA